MNDNVHIGQWLQCLNSIFPMYNSHLEILFTWSSPYSLSSCSWSWQNMLRFYVFFHYLRVSYQWQQWFVGKINFNFSIFSLPSLQINHMNEPVIFILILYAVSIRYVDDHWPHTILFVTTDGYRCNAKIVTGNPKKVFVK